MGDVARFVGEAWNSHPTFHRSSGGFDDLLSAGDVDHLLTTTSPRLPAFRLVKDGATIPTSRYTRHGRTGGSPITGIADPARILQLYREGATIVLQGMHRYWQPLRRFCRDLELALGHPTQVNAYITPPGSRGLGVHTDDHDVFVLQSFGRKRWEVWDRGAGRSPEGPPSISEELRSGDALYLPKGTPHAAHTQLGEPSGHLTIGILTTTWRSVLDEVLDGVAADERFDEPLPAGFHRDPQALAAMLESRLNEAQRSIEKLDTKRVAGRLIDRFLTSRPALLAGAFLDALEEVHLTDDTVLRRRPGSVCELRLRDGRLEALLGDRRLRMPEWLEPAMRAARDAPRLAVGELGPGLDERGRLVLARRLVREGLLEIVR